jgi:hypothetical protein
VLEIKDSIKSIDTRWTYFQAPLMVEDVFEFKFPVPSEFDFSTLDVIIQHRFREDEISRHIKAGNYELFKTKSSHEVIQSNSRLFPGMEITMAIILDRLSNNDENCPIPRCGSFQTTAAAGGGRIW